MITLYVIQIACAAVGMLLGFLTVSNILHQKRAAAAEARLANLELWASGASPIIMGLVGLTGLTGVDIDTAESETKH